MTEVVDSAKLPQQQQQNDSSNSNNPVTVGGATKKQGRKSKAPTPIYRNQDHKVNISIAFYVLEVAVKFGKGY